VHIGQIKSHQYYMAVASFSFGANASIGKLLALDVSLLCTLKRPWSIQASCFACISLP